MFDTNSLAGNQRGGRDVFEPPRTFDKFDGGRLLRLINIDEGLRDTVWVRWSVTGWSIGVMPCQRRVQWLLQWGQFRPHNPDVSRAFKRQMYAGAPDRNHLHLKFGADLDRFASLPGKNEHLLPFQILGNRQTSLLHVPGLAAEQIPAGKPCQVGELPEALHFTKL